MGILSQTVITAATPMPPKGIIYGSPGVGKTTFGASAPGALILDCEHGANMVACARTPHLKSWPAQLAVLNALANEDHPYGVVVVDTLDWMLSALETTVSGASGGKLSETLNKSNGGYGNGKQVLRNHITLVLLPALDLLVQRGLAVILLAHASRQDITDADGVTTEKTVAEIHPDFLSMFLAWSDFCCLAKTTASGKRELVCQDNGRALAKNRYGLPATLPLEWEAFAAAIAAGQNAVMPQNHNTPKE
jgi:hypothetical protein